MQFMQFMKYPVSQLKVTGVQKLKSVCRWTECTCTCTMFWLSSGCSTNNIQGPVQKANFTYFFYLFLFKTSIIIYSIQTLISFSQGQNNGRKQLQIMIEDSVYKRAQSFKIANNHKHKLQRVEEEHLDESSSTQNKELTSGNKQ